MSKEESTPPAAPDTPFVGPKWRVSLSHVGERLERTVDASLEICDWLTEELAVQTCERLACAMTITPARRGRFASTLRIQALFVQECVLTLESFEVPVDETVQVEFWPQHQIENWTADLGREMEFDDESPDPEPIVDDILDVGELVRETLVMAIDPHPRKPDASFGSISTETEAERAREKPFAALAKLRNQAGNDS